MAGSNNSSNSIYVSITRLSQAQELQSGDLIPVATATQGIQTIDFGNLNVVRTDLYGNATVLGDLTGNNMFLTTTQANSMSATSFASQGRLGSNLNTGYYNYFTVNGGIITSGAYVSYGSPDYLNVLTYLNTLTTYQSNFYSLYFDLAGQVILNSGNTSVLVDNITLPIGLTYGNFSSQPWASISLTPYGSIPGLSAAPYLYITGVGVGSTGGNTLQFTINSSIPFSFGVPVGYRILKEY